MTKRLVSLGGALALLAVVACGGGGNDSPTQPNARLVMDLRLSTGASGPPTFRGLSLFLDDALLGQVTTPEGVASHQIHVDAGPQPPGRHVIRAVITDQTVSPST